MGKLGKDFKSKDYTFVSYYDELVSDKKVIDVTNQHKKAVDFCQRAHGIAYKIYTAVSYGDEIDAETLTDWNDALDGLRKELKDDNKKSFGGLELAYKKIADDLRHMQDRVREYIAAVKPETEKCDIAAIEKSKKKLMDDYLAAHKDEQKEEVKAVGPVEKAEPKKQPVKKNDAVDLNKMEGDIKDGKRTSLKDTLAAYEATMAWSNKGWTKQSRQFKRLRTCLGKLNAELKQSGGLITEDNADRIAKLVIAVEYGIQMYKTHCMNHPKNNNRVRTIRENITEELGQKIVRISKIDIVRGKISSICGKNSREIKEQIYKNVYSGKEKAVVAAPVAPEII